MRLAVRILLLLTISLSGIAQCRTVSAADSAENWEGLRAKLAQRREMIKASETNSPPQYSKFNGKYIHPEYAQRYASFVKLNPKTGLLEYDKKVIRPVFAIYSQPTDDYVQVVDILKYDFDLLENDFSRMEQAGVNIQLRLDWRDLLDYDNTWKEVEKQPKGRGLPYFKYNYQIYDYFLDRAQVHGLYVSIQPSLYRGLHPEVVPAQYHEKILLHDEIWDAAKDAYAKILRYYSKREIITAITVSGGDLVFDHCLNDPQMLDQFKRHLRKKYGSVANLQRTWTYGYDYDNPKWIRKTVGHTVEGEQVLLAEYPFVKGAFDSWKSFDDVRLPVLDYYRSTSNPDAQMEKWPTNQENLLCDPIWIDFLEMKERMLIARLNDLAEALRSSAPNYILCYINPSDFSPAWQSIHCFDRGKLNFDIIGTTPLVMMNGQEYAQCVASYAPYIDASGGSPRGFAGDIGKFADSRNMADIIGGGSALQSCDWNTVSGLTYDKSAYHDAAVLEQLTDFLALARGTSFSRKNDAQVLILRNKHAAYGMSAGYDFGNAAQLANILYRLHVPFDILPDSDVTAGAFEHGKVNLGKYKFIFVPAQNQLLSNRTWQMLKDWVSDPRYVGQRGLCLGLWQDQDCYFNPVKPVDVHPAFERLTGGTGFSRRVPVRSVKLRYARFYGSAIRGDEIALEFPPGAELGCFDKPQAEALLTIGEDETAVVVRNLVNGNPIYTCGFYLGLVYDAVSGMGHNPCDALSPLYMAMLNSVGVEPSVVAPANLGVYLSDDASAVLIKEQSGKDTDVELNYKRMLGTVYGDATTIFTADSTQVKDFRIESDGVLLLRKAAGFGISGEANVSAVCKPTSDGGLDFTLSGKGKVVVSLEMKPKTIYSIRENGVLLKVFTADQGVSHPISFNLDDGSKPLDIQIKPSSRKT